MPSRSKETGKVNRRSDILRAAEKLMYARGLSGVTTRSRFPKKWAVQKAHYTCTSKDGSNCCWQCWRRAFRQCFNHSKPFKTPLGVVRPKATSWKRLTASGIFRFHQRVVPASAGLFAEPELLAAYRNSLVRQSEGPHLLMRVLADYIRSQQRLGRINSHADANHAARLIMSSSFFRAFSEQFFGIPMQPAWREFAKELIATAASALARE